MSLQDNLEKTKKLMSMANFGTAALMLLAYAFAPEGSFNKLLLLVPAVLFILAGLGIIVFVNKLQKRFDQEV